MVGGGKSLATTSDENWQVGERVCLILVVRGDILPLTLDLYCKSEVEENHRCTIYSSVTSRTRRKNQEQVCVDENTHSEQGTQRVITVSLFEA